MQVGRPSAAGPDPDPIVQTVAFTSGQARPSPISLAAAIQFGLEFNPRLRAAFEAIRRAEGQETVEFAPFLPQVDSQLRYVATTFNLSPGAPGPTGGVIPSSLFADHQFAQAEIDAQWMLWDFGRTPGRYGRAVARRRVAQAQFERARQTVTFDVAAAYFGVLLAQANVRIQEESVRRSQSVLSDTRNRRNAGVADKDDLLRAEVQLSEAREALISAQQTEFEAKARLNYVMGRDSTALVQVADPQLPIASDASLLDGLQAAIVQRPEVAVARESVAAAQFGSDAASSDSRPKIYVRASGGYIEGDGVLTGFHGGAGIHLDQQLYAGRRREGERASAEAEVRAAFANAQIVFDTISLEVNLAYRMLTAARARIPLAQMSITQAQENLRLIRVKYQNGNATPTDVVDAETALVRSEQRFYSALYESMTAHMRLAYAIGGAFPTQKSQTIQLDAPQPIARSVPLE